MSEQPGVWMPPGELSHRAPLGRCEMLSRCPVVALCPHLLLTLQAEALLNRNTAVSLPWAQAWGADDSWPMILQLEGFSQPFPVSVQPLRSPTAGTSHSRGSCPPGDSSVPVKGCTGGNDKNWERLTLLEKYRILNIPQGGCVTCCKICRVLAWKSAPSLPKRNFSYRRRISPASSPGSRLQCNLRLLLLLLYFLSSRYYSEIFSHFLLDFILQFASLFS